MGRLTTVPLPFAEGLTQQEAVEWTDSGASASGVTNGNFTKHGAVDKRLGMGHLPNTLAAGGNASVPALSSGLRAMSWTRSGLSIATAGALYGYSAAQQGVVGIGTLPPVVATRTPITSSRTPQNASICLVPYNGSLMRLAMFPTLSQSGAYTVVLTANDANTGDTILEPLVIHSNAQVWVQQLLYIPLAPVNQSVAFCFMDSVNNAYLGTFDPTTNTAAIHVTATNQSDAPDLALVEGYTGGAVVFTQNDGGTIAYLAYSPSWALLGSGTLDTGVSATNGGHMSAVGNVNDLHVSFVWAKGSAIRFGQCSTLSFTIVAASITTVATAPGNANVSGITRDTSGNLFFTWWTGYGSGNSGAWAAGGMLTAHGAWMYLNPVGPTTIATGSIPTGMLPVFAPFFVNGIPYQPATLNFQLDDITQVESAGTYSEQGTSYLLQFFGASTGGASVTCLPVATVAPRQIDTAIYLLNRNIATNPPSPQSLGLHCPHVGLYPYASPSWFSAGIRVFGVDEGANSDAIATNWAVDWKFDAASQAASLYQPGEIGGELRLSGAVPFVSDGAGCYEASFFSYPEFALATGSSGGENYTYAIVFSYTDAAGLTERGSPAFTNAITTSSLSTGGTNLVTIPPVCSWRQTLATGNVYAEIYRTTNGGGSFNLVDRVEVSPTTVTTYSDTTTDALIQKSSFLYTTGGILDNVNPPAALCQAIHKGRLWIVDETGENIWFSKSFTPGLSPGFNETNSISFSDRGPMTGLFSLDDKLIVGKATGLWYIIGDGPADNGQGSDLQTPQAISADAGPVDWRAGVVFPGGLIYRSVTGIMLCDRSMNVSWIGKDVVDSLAAYPTVLSATVVPQATQIRFVCANATGQTTTLVYDYLASKWVQHSYPFQPAGVASGVLAAVSAGATPSFASITTDGKLWLEHQPSDTTAYMDDDAAGAAHFNPTSVTTSWVKIQGVQGYQRARQVQLFFEDLDDCGLTMAFAVNYASAQVQSHTWSSAIIDALPRNIVQQHVGAQWMKQLALQVTVSDVAGTNAKNGQGARFVSLSLELEAIGATYRQVPAIGRA